MLLSIKIVYSIVVELSILQYRQVKHHFKQWKLQNKHYQFKHLLSDDFVQLLP